LDEASVRTEARTMASSYLPNKPDKNAIRFYAVLGSTNTYISSIVDNRAGNKTGESGPEAFCRVHREMKAKYNKTLGKSDIVDKDSPTALWILQMAHQTKLYPDPSGKRVFFTDNYYTRHTLAKELKAITDNEARLCGTVKFTNVDSINRAHLTEAISLMKDATRGSWKLVQAYDKIPDLDKLRRKHIAAEKKKPASQRTQFVPPTELVAENAGYIVWKDSKLVVFYTNDLASTPSRPILDGTSDEAISCVRGVAPVKQWTGSETLHQTSFMVPAIIVAYNIYMNAVDRMDQKRATNPTRRKEQHLHMSLFTYILDLAALQAYSVFQIIRPSERSISFVEFKRSLCEDFVTQYRSHRKRPCNVENEPLAVENVLGSNEHSHMLIENMNRAGINCYFCLFRGIKKKTIYGCVKCKKGFHVNCYTAYHCQGALQGDAKALSAILMSCEGNLPRASNKKSKHVGDISSLKLAR